MSPRLLVLLLCAVNLVAGAAGGVLLDRNVLADKRPAPRQWGGGDPSRMIDKKLEDMTARLGLDGDQATRVREVLVARQPAIHAAFKELQPKLDKLRADSDEKIKAILRPEQVAKYNDYVAELARKHAARGGSAAVGSDSKEASK